MSLLSIKDLCKTYIVEGKEFQALKGVSLDVEDGECVGIIGESGSGKSTIANILAGFLPASSGSIQYDGYSLLDKKCDKNARNSMQMIFQNAYGSFSPRMRLGKGIREGLLYLSDLPAKEQEKRVDQVMELVGLPLDYKSKYVFEVSGGEAQRAAIARSILIHPRLLICDECTSALDAEVQGHLIELLSELKERMKMSILFISHDIGLVKDFCDKVYVVHAGQIAESGKTADLFANPQNPYTRCLIKAGTSIEL